MTFAFERRERCDAYRVDSVDLLHRTIIERPRAALAVDEVAESTWFFGSGADDLTQMTFGLARDDIRGFLGEDLDEGILPEETFRVPIARLAAAQAQITHPRK